MRTRTLHSSLAALCLVAASGCATMSGGSSTGTFPGKEIVDARIKEINGKLPVAEPCNSEKDPPLGIVEVTAKADGKVVARSFMWKGSPTTAACIVDAAQKMTLAPLLGPSVSGIWWFVAPGTQHPTPPTSSKGDMAGMQGRLQVEVEACAQRYLPNDFGVDIEVSYFILPGGQAIAPTVTLSTAKDGDYETCVQNIIASKKMPESGFDGPFPASSHFHVGPVDKL